MVKILKQMDVENKFESPNTKDKLKFKRLLNRELRKESVR